jgi:hypothetical protein
MLKKDEDVDRYIPASFDENVDKIRWNDGDIVNSMISQIGMLTFDNTIDYYDIDNNKIDYE